LHVYRDERHYALGGARAPKKFNSQAGLEKIPPAGGRRASHAPNVLTPKGK